MSAKDYTSFTVCIGETRAVASEGGWGWEGGGGGGGGGGGRGGLGGIPPPTPEIRQSDCKALKKLSLPPHPPSRRNKRNYWNYASLNQCCHPVQKIIATTLQTRKAIQQSRDWVTAPYLCVTP